MQQRMDPVWVEVSKENLKHNVGVLRARAPVGTVFAPAVKANAYGHGLVETARLLLLYGASWLSVGSLTEAVALRSEGITAPLLLIGPFLESDIPAILEAEVHPFISSLEIADILSNAAGREGKRVSVHVKIDTGMNRQGVAARDAVSFTQALARLPGLFVEGIATHFATADDKDEGLTLTQLKRFNAVLSVLSAQGIRFRYIHAAKSAALLLYPGSHFTLVRPGLATYGIYPGLYVRARANAELRPSLSFKARIVSIRNVPKGESVGYGAAFVADRPLQVALLPVGYADGFDRRLSNKGHVLVRGSLARIVGRVCMGMTMVDVTDISGVKVGEEAVLIGSQGNEHIAVEEIAEVTETIPHEVVSRLRESIPRYYV